MKTVTPCFLLIFIAYILQSSVFNIIAYDGISVDLILLLVIFFSIIYDKYAILYGFCAGLFQDLASGYIPWYSYSKSCYHLYLNP